MGEVLKGLINNNNLLEYLKKKYNVDNIQKSIKVNQLIDMQPLVQDDYGDDNDCTLTAITTILTHYCNKTPEEIYAVVVKFGRKLGYNAKAGTNPLVMRTLMNLAAKELGVKKTAAVRYGKNVSYNFAGIKKHIDANRPMMLSIFKDGRNFYNDHSITVIGYGEYQIDNKRKARMIKVYDNWYREVAYVDYDLLCVFSSIHYYN